MKPERQVVCEGLVFPETPRWHRGRLWFCDIHAHQVKRLNPDGSCTVMATLADRAGGLGFTPSGAPLVVSMLDKRLLRLNDDGTVTQVADFSRLPCEFLLDMVVDSQGRAYIGTRNPDSIVITNPDGTTEVATENIVSPNGMALLNDMLIVAETRSERLAAFDIGFDGVEIHAAHSYLLSEFLTPAYNHRTDGYGGSLENRMRFLINVLQAVRSAVGQDFPVGVRLNTEWQLGSGSFTRHDSMEASQVLADSGLVDFLNMSAWG